MTGDMVAWLRATIEGDLRAAKEAEAVSPGPWVNTGQAGCGEAWQIHGAPTEESGVEWDDEVGDVVRVPSRVATLNYGDGGGVWTREAADHIVLQQPRDTIARCEFELAEVVRHEQGPCYDCMVCSDHEADYPCSYLRRLASSYRHREGYREEWAP